MPGVTIGKNSIVGAHSFVTNDVPDNTLVYGIPARIVRKI
jgi:maltose O-acetyltransferase